jgi:hypothetical protein
VASVSAIVDPSQLTGDQTSFGSRQRDPGIWKPLVFGFVVINLCVFSVLCSGLVSRWQTGPNSASGLLDFNTYYSGGQLSSRDRGADMFDLREQSKAQAEIGKYAYDPTDEPVRVVAFVNPPTSALILRPLSKLTLDRSYRIWMIANAAVLALAGWLACRNLSISRRDRLFVQCCAAAAFPVSSALLQGSISPLVALGFALVSTGVVSDKTTRWRDFSIAGGMLLIGAKPQYVLLPLALLMGLRMWRAVAITVIGQGFLVALTMTFLKPTVWVDYAELLAAFNRNIDTYGNATSSMINVRGVLARLIGASQSGAINAVSSALFLIAAVGIAILAHRVRMTEKTGNRSRAALVCVMLLVGIVTSPHAHSHDWLIALVALPLLWTLRTRNQPNLPNQATPELDREVIAIGVLPLLSYFSMSNLGSTLGKLPIALALLGIGVAGRALAATTRRAGVNATTAARTH